MEQQKLFGEVDRETQAISDELIRRQTSLLAAIKLSVQASGLDEKEIFIPLGIDKATWSKILSGQFNFPTNKYEQFMDLVGNEVPLKWLAFARGYRLIELQDANKRRIAELEEKLIQRDQEIETLVKYGVIQRAKA